MSTSSTSNLNSPASNYPPKNPGRPLEDFPPGESGASASFQSRDGSLRYSLQILQQPVRARMCGFGDRDRRLLTPPVIVQLHVTDATTNQPIPADEVDITFFILNADLWAADRSEERNMVMHPAFASEAAARAGGISSSISIDRPRLPPISAITSGLPGIPDPSMSPSHAHQQQLDPARGGGSGIEMTYTRNLIGALTQNAFKLIGMDGKLGIFFIYHDLSIRTEGFFCFKLTFVSLDNGGRRTEQDVDTLAEIFTDVFQVYSAKKFPGMIEPTTLSKHLQTQGVRIPTRTTQRRGRGAGEGDGDDSDDDDGD